jgi:hypothetical protein
MEIVYKKVVYNEKDFVGKMMSLVGKIFTKDKPYHSFTAQNWVDETMEIGGANYDEYAYVIGSGYVLADDEPSFNPKLLKKIMIPDDDSTSTDVDNLKKVVHRYKTVFVPENAPYCVTPPPSLDNESSW